MCADFKSLKEVNKEIFKWSLETRTKWYADIHKRRALVDFGSRGFEARKSHRPFPSCRIWKGSGVVHSTFKSLKTRRSDVQR